MSTTTTSSSKAAPWGPVQGDLNRIVTRARSMFEADPGGKNMYAPRNNLVTNAENSLIKQANRGDLTQGTDVARSSLVDMMQGNPYRKMNDVRDNIWSSVAPQVNSVFANAGRFGSGDHADRMTRAFTEAYAPVAMSQYNADQNRMLQAAGMLPGLDEAALMDERLLTTIGGARQADQQMRRDADWAQLQRFLGIAQPVGGMGGINLNSQTDPGPHPLQLALGGAGMLAGFL